MFDYNTCKESYEWKPNAEHIPVPDLPQIESDNANIEYNQFDAGSYSEF